MALESRNFKSLPFCPLAPSEQKVAGKVDRLQPDSQLLGDCQVKHRQADRDSSPVDQNLKREAQNNEKLKSPRAL